MPNYAGGEAGTREDREEEEMTTEGSEGESAGGSSWHQASSQATLSARTTEIATVDTNQKAATATTAAATAAAAAAAVRGSSASTSENGVSARRRARARAQDGRTISHSKKRLVCGARVPAPSCAAAARDDGKGKDRQHGQEGEDAVSTVAMGESVEVGSADNTGAFPYNP